MSYSTPQCKRSYLYLIFVLGTALQVSDCVGIPNSPYNGGRKCYITPAFSGVPNAKRGEKIRSGYLTPAFSGVPNKGDKIKVGPKEGGNATSPLHSRGSPTKGTKSKWAQKRAETLHHPCILGGSQTNGDKIRIGCLNPAFLGSHKWAKCYLNPAFSGIPNKGDKNKALKRQKKQKKQKISHGGLDPSCGPVDCPHWAFNPGPFSCRGSALPLGYGPSLTHLCTGVVFIFGPIWSSSIIAFSSKKLSILSIDTWGENPFFHRLLIQAKFASGAFGAHGPALSSQFPGRGGGGSV